MNLNIPSEKLNLNGKKESVWMNSSWPFQEQGKRREDNSGEDISIDRKGEMAHAMI